MYEFKPDQAYRLVTVTEHDGQPKQEHPHYPDFYKERIGCATKSIETGMRDWEGRFYLCVAFIQDKDGNWANYHLQTSPISDIREKDGKIEVVTHNSIYVFEPTTLKEPVFQDEAELIELYLSTGSHDMFCTGYYYDADKNPHELVNHMHVGTFQDSCLIMQKDRIGATVCRFFPFPDSIEFYDTIYHQQDYSRRMLIHNAGKTPIQVKFERFPAKWTIQPGDSKIIVPYSTDGVDQEDEI